jgi:hypothetical protein
MHVPRARPKRRKKEAKEDKEEEVPGTVLRQ